MKHKINVLGSCVSRVPLLDGNIQGHGVYDEDLDIAYFFDKQNIVCALMPPPFTKDEVDTITADELYLKSTLRALKQCLNKDTINLLMNSDSDWLIIDFYDFQTDFTTFNNTAFSNYVFEFYNTKLYHKYQNEAFGTANFFMMPTWMWYPYVDIFFDIILKKYDNDHIILNRFRSSKYVLLNDGTISELPAQFKGPHRCNDKYNVQIRCLEDYVIRKYHPYIIDISRYFLADFTFWNEFHGSHFEKEYYREAFDCIKQIIFHQPANKIFNATRLTNFNRRGYDEDMKRPFNIECGLNMIQQFIKNNDPVWVSVLDKLISYAPDDSRVIELKNDLLKIKCH